MKMLEQLEGCVFGDGGVAAAPSVRAGTSHGVANALPPWAHWFVPTNPLLFAQEPPRGLFPSLGAVGSGLAVGRDGSLELGLGASIPAAFVQAAPSDQERARA